MPLKVSVFRYPLVRFIRTEVTEGIPYETEVVGDLVLNLVEYLLAPEILSDFDIEIQAETVPSLVELFFTSTLDVIELVGGGQLLFKIVAIATGAVLYEIVADTIHVDVDEEPLIVAKNIPISGKGVVDVGSQLNIRKQGEIWLWRGTINVTSYDSSIVDVSYDNPNRYYFGMATISNFGSCYKPYWIRTANDNIPIYQITPNYEGKADSDGGLYQNCLYSYPRADRIIYDLRPKVFALLKLTSVRILSNLINWW